MSKNPCDCKHISMDSIIKTVKTRDPHQTEFLQVRLIMLQLCCKSKVCMRLKPERLCLNY